jgi:hypothetical protein
MNNSTGLEEEIWELRERTAQLQLDLVRTQRRLRALELYLPITQVTSSYRSLDLTTSDQQSRSNAEPFTTAEAPTPTAQKTSEIPEQDIKPLPMEERMKLIREYAERYGPNYSQKVIAAALHISTSTYNNMLAGRGIYAKYVVE